LEKLKRRDEFEDLNVSRRTIIKWIWRSALDLTGSG
jgi:hypothetical protein